MENDDESDGTAAKPKRGRIVIAAVVLSSLAAIGGAVVAIGPDRMLAMVTGAADEGSSKDPEKTESDGETDAPKDSGLVELMPFDEMIVNITSVTATGRRTSRFLKVNIALAINPEAEGVERLVQRKIFIRDAMQDFLRQLHEDDLAGSAGVALLKSELLRRARIVAETEAPREVLFADLVIQ
ncbi:flagellar basal body-associated FliL family protein [Roseivivax sp. CAU 1753]